MLPIMQTSHIFIKGVGGGAGGVDLRSTETRTGGSHESIASALLIPYRCASAFL